MHVLFYSIIKLRNESTCESDTQEHTHHLSGVYQCGAHPSFLLIWTFPDSKTNGFPRKHESSRGSILTTRPPVAFGDDSDCDQSQPKSKRD